MKARAVTTTKYECTNCRRMHDAEDVAVACCKCQRAGCTRPVNNKSGRSQGSTRCRRHELQDLRVIAKKDAERWEDLAKDARHRIESFNAELAMLDAAEVLEKRSRCA